MHRRDFMFGCAASALAVSLPAVPADASPRFYARRLTYPTREISFISYRDEKSAGSRFAHVIHCCSEHSQYDPAEGAKVVAGPAPQPLAAILLEYDPENDGLYAVGTLGGELFNEFFSKYEFRLALDHSGHARAAVEGRSIVSELTEYCRQQVKC